MLQASVCQVFKEVTLEMEVVESVQTGLLDTVVLKERDYRQTCTNRHELHSLSPKACS